MPYAAKPKIFDPNDPNKQNPNISGGSGASFDTGVPGQDAGAPKDKKSSGQYANIQSYLDANKDQGDQMGQKIASDVSAKADDATNQINSLSAKAPTVAAYDPNQAYGKLGSLSDAEKNTYRTQRQTGGYSGPSTVDQVEGYNETMKATNEAAQKAKAAGNEYGQQQLLKETYKRPQYSAGENRLDQVLVQGSDNSKQALQGVNQKYAPLEQMFSTASTNVGNAVNTANKTAQENRQKVLTAEEQQWNNLMNPIQARADQMNKDNTSLIGRVYGDVANNDSKVNDETMKLLGLAEGQNIYDLDLSGYVNRDESQVGINNAATAEERSRYQALADLIQDSSRTQLTADGKQINPVSFNKDQFQKDLAGKQAFADRFMDQDSRGRFYQWAEQNNATYTDGKGNQNRVGGEAFDLVNSKSGRELETMAKDLKSGALGTKNEAEWIKDYKAQYGPYAFKFLQDNLDGYINSLRDSVGANRKIEKES